MTPRREGLGWQWYVALTLMVLAVFILCVCVGSVAISPNKVLAAVFGRLERQSAAYPIIIKVRLPRVLCAGLVGASLSVCGATMQGLLRNPLADVSTLGVSSGASLGAVAAIVLGIGLPGFRGSAIVPLAILSSFLSLFFILLLAGKLDYSYATNTILLVGIVFMMFAQSMISLLIAFAGDKVQRAVMWTMGSMAGSDYRNVALVAVALLLCGGVILRYLRELNAFAIGEENARNVGIDVKRVKLCVLAAVSVLTGVCVSVGGTIAFVGLIVPHICRILTGPNHKKLIPACLFGGAAFLMLGDLLARVLLNPVELPVGVVTSIVGAAVFVQIFYSNRKVG